jgi:hypothetical protein
VLLAGSPGCKKDGELAEANLPAATNSAFAVQTNAVPGAQTGTELGGDRPAPASLVPDHAVESVEGAAQTSAPALVASADILPPQPVVIAVKWFEGSRYIYRIDIEQRSTNQLPNTPEPAAEEIVTGLSYALTASSLASDGSQVLEVELLAFDTEIRIGTNVVVKFDSAHPEGEGGKVPPIPQPYRNVAGSKVRLRTAPGGKVDEVLGYDEWVRTVTGDPTGTARQMLVQQFNPGFFRQLADFGRGLPDRPVSPGDRWPHHIQIPAGELGTIRAESGVEFKEWLSRDHEKFAVIEARGTLSSRPGGGASGKPSMWIERGTVEGRSWFDPELGAMMESCVEQSMRVRGETPVQEGESQPAAADFVSDIGQKVTVKLIEIRKAQQDAAGATVSPAVSE